MPVPPIRPEAVIFDIGNVLIEWQPERFYDRVIGSVRRRQLFDAVDMHAVNDRVDLGSPFRETIFAAAEENPDFRDEIRMWHDRWIEMATPVIARSVILLRALRARGVAVFALSNFGIDSFSLAEKHYAFLGEFDRRYISGHMQVTKPDAEIYRRVETDSGIAPEKLLFTDDRKDNIEAAQARGWQVHHFDGPAGLAARLVADGLLSPAETGIDAPGPHGD
ncbi:MAG: HAD family hydrolase [Halocynthiibacter sp.]